MIRRHISITFLGLSIASCGLSDSASDAQQSMSSLQAEFESFDLTCAFDDLTGTSETVPMEPAEGQAPANHVTGTATSTSTATNTTTTACQNSEEQYSVLVDKFDTDGDGVLSDSELAEAQAGWEEAQKAEMDANGDGTVSEDEKAAFRKNKLLARKDKLQKNFEEGCKAKGKEPDECRQRREHHREKLLEHMKERLTEFDQDGDGKLSQEEKKAMIDKLRQEREQRKDEFGKQMDKNGDGMISPEEHQ